jgi:hypothetical protein
VSSSLFPGLDSLVGLTRHGVDVKPTLLRVLTDLYVQKPSHTEEEERQFVELTLRLVDAVDAATREAVTQRLSAYAGAPAAVLKRLLGDSAEHGGAEREGCEAAGAARPSQQAASGAASAAHGLRFFAGDEAERAAILAELDAPDQSEDLAVVAPAEETIRRLEASALAGRPSDFIRELERALGVSRALAEAVVNDRAGDPLVVAARALAMPVAVLQRILMFVNPSVGHSVRRVYALTALFERMSPLAALRLVASWRAMGDAPSPARRRVTPPQGTPAARGVVGRPAHQRLAARTTSAETAPSAYDSIEKTAS